MYWYGNKEAVFCRNLTEFEEKVDETSRLSETFPLSHMRKLLDVDLDHSRNLLFVLRLNIELPEV